jgi:hypothetical protein
MKGAPGKIDRRQKRSSANWLLLQAASAHGVAGPKALGPGLKKMAWQGWQTANYHVWLTWNRLGQRRSGMG